MLNQLDGVLVDKGKQAKVRRLYEWASGMDERYGAQLRAAKAEILEISFASELEVLTSDLRKSPTPTGAPATLPSTRSAGR